MKYMIILLTIITACLIMNQNCNAQENSDALILWSNTVEYRSKEQLLPMCEEDALRLLIEATRVRRGAYFDKSALFIIGDEYFFPSTISKDKICIEGYYVNASTRRMEYRKSKYVLNYRRKGVELPEAAFSDVQVLSEPRGHP